MYQPAMRYLDAKPSLHTPGTHSGVMIWQGHFECSRQKSPVPGHDFLDLTEGKMRIMFQRNFRVEGRDYQEDPIVRHAIELMFDMFDEVNRSLFMPQELWQKTRRRQLAFSLEKIFNESFKYSERMRAAECFGLFSFFYNLYIGNLSLDDEVPIGKLEIRELPGEGIFFADMDSDDYGEELKPIYSYHGQVVDDQPHGIGQMFYINHGILIEGQFTDGKPNGYCRIID